MPPPAHPPAPSPPSPVGHAGKTRLWSWATAGPCVPALGAMGVVECVQLVGTTLHVLNHPAVLLVVVALLMALVTSVKRALQPRARLDAAALRQTIFVAMVVPVGAGRVQLDGLFDRAALPARVVVAVYDTEERVEFHSRWRMNVRLARHLTLDGRPLDVARARAWLVRTMRRGELCTLLVPADAHFAAGWDRTLLDMLERNGEQTVLTGRCAAPEEGFDALPRFLCARTRGAAGEIELVARRARVAPSARTPSLFWSAQLSFCRSDVFDRVPLVPSASDAEEDLLNSFALYTHGLSFAMFEQVVARAPRAPGRPAAPRTWPAVGKVRSRLEFQAYTGVHTRRLSANARAHAGLSPRMLADECACKYGSSERARRVLHWYECQIAPARSGGRARAQ